MRPDAEKLRVESNQFFVQRNHAALMELVRASDANGYRGRIKSDANRADRVAFAGAAERPSDT